MLLEDRACVVSGVGPGLGREIALAFAREGAVVVLAARTASFLDEVAAEIEAMGSRAVPVPTDVTDPEACRRLVDTTVARLGRVDVLVNSAFRPDVFKTFEEVDLDEWRSLMEINCFASLQLTQRVVPHMKGSGGGSIVFINSMATRKIPPRQGGYAASKGALLVAARALAVELGRYRIRVNSVLPGWMWGPSVEGYVAYTAKRRGVTEAAVIDDLTRAIPLGTIPTDGDTAGAVVFLASDLSAAVTGQTLDVNGGEVLS